MLRLHTHNVTMFAPNSTRPTDYHADKRVNRRKPPKRGVMVECRRGQLGLGRNLALQIIDITDGGICLQLTDELPLNDVVELILIGVGRSKPLKMLADVRWVSTVDEGIFQTGMRFRKRIPYADLNLYC